MPKEIIEFLDSQQVGVLSVELEGGAPHGAAIHFGYRADPFAVVILTSLSSSKMQPLIAKGSTRASLVIGTDQQTMRTLQIDGIASFPAGDDERRAYFARFPEREAKFTAAEDALLVVTPSWWRYTDYKAPGGKRVLTSE